MATTMTKPSSKPNWFMQTLGSSLGRKVLMALTGLFLILFLTIHLIGNLQLLIPYFSPEDKGKTFNEYAEFMGHNKLIQLVSIVNFICIITHVKVSIILTLHNRSARPQQYAYVQANANSKLVSRQMMTLGTIVLAFIIVHLVNFWGQMKFSTVPKDAHGLKDLFVITHAAFQNPYLVAGYVLAMVAIAFHLSHGFQSGFQTLGLNHKKYSPFIKTLGGIYAILVPALFALIPIVMFFVSLK